MENLMKIAHISPQNKRKYIVHDENEAYFRASMITSHYDIIFMTIKHKKILFKELKFVFSFAFLIRLSLL